MSTAISPGRVDRVSPRADQTADDAAESNGEATAFGDVLQAVAGASILTSQAHPPPTTTAAASADPADVPAPAAASADNVSPGTVGAASAPALTSDDVIEHVPTGDETAVPTATTLQASASGSVEARRDVGARSHDAAPPGQGPVDANEVRKPSAPDRATTDASGGSDSAATVQQSLLDSSDVSEPSDASGLDHAVSDRSASDRSLRADRSPDGVRQVRRGDDVETAVNRIARADSDSDSDTATTVRPEHAGRPTPDSARSSLPTDTPETTSHGESDPAIAADPADEATPSLDVDVEPDSAELRPADTARSSRANDATRTGSTPATALTERAEQADHAAEMARASLRRSGDLTRLGLDVVTDDLGVIRVEAMDRRGGLQLNLASQDPATRALLNERLPELLGDLREAGVELGSLDITGGQQHDRSSAGKGNEPVPTGRTSDRDIGPATTSTADTDPATIGQGAGNADGLDRLDHLDLRL